MALKLSTLQQALLVSLGLLRDAPLVVSSPAPPAGWMLAVCLVVLLAGGFHALEIPARYLAPLAGLAGRG